MDFVGRLVEKCHVGYIVQDAESAVKNLQEKLCCAIDAKVYMFVPQKVWTSGFSGEGFALKIALCRIKDNMTIEYIQPITQAGYHFNALRACGEHMNHVCFATEDYDRYFAEFKAMGASILFEAEVNDPENGYRRCFYAKIEGIPGVFEILENAKPYRYP